MAVDIEHQIEYAERLFQTAKRKAETDNFAATKLPSRVLRQMEKDLRSIEAIVETLKAAKAHGEGMEFCWLCDN